MIVIASRKPLTTTIDSGRRTDFVEIPVADIDAETTGRSFSTIVKSGAEGEAVVHGRLDRLSTCNREVALALVVAIVSICKQRDAR